MGVINVKEFKVTVNCVIFGFIKNSGLQVCLIKRIRNPFLGSWALPGGFIERNESLEHAILRELEYDTGIKKIELKQIFTFDEEDANHITISYYGLVNTQNQSLMAKVKEKNATWFPVKKLPQLAFDHAKIIGKAFDSMRLDAFYQPILKKMLGASFDLTELQHILEEVFDCKFDKSNFRKKINEIDLVKKTGRKKVGVGHIEPQLYRFSRGNVAKKIGHKLFGYASFMGKLISKKFN